MNLSIYTQDKPISGTLLSHGFLIVENKAVHLLVLCFVLVWMVLVAFNTMQKLRNPSIVLFLIYCSLHRFFVYVKNFFRVF
jgi:hypothetical protein